MDSTALDIAVMYLMARESEMSAATQALNWAVIVVAVAGACLGVYAAGQDIANKWSICAFGISFDFSSLLMRLVVYFPV